VLYHAPAQLKCWCTLLQHGVQWSSKHNGEVGTGNGPLLLPPFQHYSHWFKPVHFLLTYTGGGKYDLGTCSLLFLVPDAGSFGVRVIIMEGCCIPSSLPRSPYMYKSSLNITTFSVHAARRGLSVLLRLVDCHSIALPAHS